MQCLQDNGYDVADECGNHEVADHGNKNDDAEIHIMVQDSQHDTGQKTIDDAIDAAYAYILDDPFLLSFSVISPVAMPRMTTDSVCVAALPPIPATIGMAAARATT